MVLDIQEISILDQIKIHFLLYHFFTGRTQASHFPDYKNPDGKNPTIKLSKETQNIIKYCLERGYFIINNTLTEENFKKGIIPEPNPPAWDLHIKHNLKQLDVYNFSEHYSSMIENQEKLKGIKIHLKISEDKKNAIAIFDFDLSKIDQEQLIQSASDSESSQTFFRKLQDKPEVVFDYLKGQGLKEE